MKFNNGDRIICRQSTNRSWTRIGAGRWNYSLDNLKTVSEVETWDENRVSRVIDKDADLWEFQPVIRLFLRGISRFWTDAA